MKRVFNGFIMLIILVTSILMVACTGTGGGADKSKTTQTTEAKHTPQQPSEDWLAEQDKKGIEVLPIESSVLYTNGEAYIGKYVYTVVTADAALLTGKTIKSKTPNNDTSFYSLIFEFDDIEPRNLNIEQGDKVAVLGKVSEISQRATVTLKECHIIATEDATKTYEDKILQETPSSGQHDDDSNKPGSEPELGVAKKMEGLQVTVNEFVVKNHMLGLKKFPRATEGFKYVTVYLDVHNSTTSSIDFTKLLTDNAKYVFTLRFDGALDYNESYSSSKEFLRYYDDLPAQGTYKNLAICFEVPEDVATKDGTIELILSKNQIITMADDVFWLLRK